MDFIWCHKGIQFKWMWSFLHLLTNVTGSKLVNFILYVGHSIDWISLSLDSIWGLTFYAPVISFQLLSQTITNTKTCVNGSKHPPNRSVFSNSKINRNISCDFIKSSSQSVYWIFDFILIATVKHEHRKAKDKDKDKEYKWKKTKKKSHYQNENYDFIVPHLFWAFSFSYPLPLFHAELFTLFSLLFAASVIVAFGEKKRKEPYFHANWVYISRPLTFYHRRLWKL